MRKLYRSRRDRIFAGVLGGLGNYLHVDPFFFRVLFVIIFIFTGILPLLIAYLIAILMIPTAPKSYVPEPYKRLYRSRKNRKLAGIFGGIGEVYHIDATILRILYVVLFFMTGLVPLLICYIFGYFIIPER